MKIVPASWSFEEPIPTGEEILSKIERAARTCYKSEDKITLDSATKLIKGVIARGHESALEHAIITVRIICDRGVSHELVRHRIGASYSQESTRFCNYGAGKFGGEVTFIDIKDHLSNVSPICDDRTPYGVWLNAMAEAEANYFRLLNMGATPQIARSVLPNSLKTELVVTYNIRSWRHFFGLRTAKDAHPQMREITLPMLKEFRNLFPVLFDDVGVVE
jgi:thymidylate synthase (FAD)